MATLIDLSALGTGGFVIQGDADFDNAGSGVSSAGDVDGDGFGDLIVGAPYNDSGGSSAGAAYVIFGKANGFGPIDLAALAAIDGFKIQGDAGDSAGRGVSSAGDVDGDGFGDLIVGAPVNDNGGAAAGAAYVVFGKASGFGPIDLAALAAADGFIIQGDVAGDGAGFSVSSAGDVNGDGFGDIVVGAPVGDDGGANAGEAYVIFGKAGGFGTIDLTGLAAADGFVIQGDYTGDRAGHGVSSAGDVNGDGLDDIIVGARLGNDGGTDAGAAYVIFGRTAGWGTIDLTGLAGADGFAIRGDAAGDQAGYGVSSAGDVNGDGYDDLIVGAPNGDDGGSYAGEAYVIFGKASGFGTIDLTGLAPADGFIIQGDSAEDSTGRSVSSAGDVNGDGFDDVIVGASTGDDGGTFAGEAYVVFGKANGFSTVDLTSLAPADGFVIQGDAAGDQAGFSVSGAGDVDGDGFDDLLIGAPFNGSGGTGAGAAYVVFGIAPTGDVTRIGTDIGQAIRGGIGDDKLEGLGGDDGLFGGDGDDALVGGSGHDTLDGGGGDDVISGGSGDDAIDGGGGFDAISGGSGNDAIRAGGGNATLDGGSGNDTMFGGFGTDRLFGRTGNDQLNGGGGADQLEGGLGNDRYFVDSIGDVLVELLGEGGDRVFASTSYALGEGVHVEKLTTRKTGGSDAIDLSGNDLVNQIVGNHGANRLSGGGGDDTLSGQDGADRLTGGGGGDRLRGGEGADIFAFSGGDTGIGAARDRIFDFEQGSDRIDLSAIDANANTAANNTFSFIGDAAFSGTAGQLRFAAGTGTIVEGDTDGDGAADFQIALTGAIAPVAGDFML